MSSLPSLVAENRDTGGLALLLLILKLARLACSPVSDDILRRPPTAPPTAPPPPPAPPVSEVRRGKAGSPVADVILRSPPTAPPLTATPAGTVEGGGAPVSETIRRSPPTLLACCGVVRRGERPFDSEGFLGNILLASVAEEAAVAAVIAAPAALSCRDTENEARISCSSSALRLCVSCSNVLHTTRVQRDTLFELK